MARGSMTATRATRERVPDLPSVWWPTTRIAGASKGFSKSCASECSALYASYSASLPLRNVAELLRGRAPRRSAAVAALP